MAAALAFFSHGPQAAAAPTALSLRSFPPGALLGAQGAPIEVAVLDGAGALAVDSSAPVTLLLGPHPTGAQLGGTTKVNAVAGVATFTDVTLATPGHGFLLYATSPGLAAATSAPFAFALPQDPREPLGYGCASGGSGPGSGLLALAPLFLLFFLRKCVRKQRLAGAALAVALLTGSAASAQTAELPAVAEMKALYQRGVEALQANRLDEALRLFEQARARFDSPTLLYYIAECYRRAGRDEKAVEYYLTYLDRVPDRAKQLDTSLLEIARNKVSNAARAAGLAAPVAQRRTFTAPGLSLAASLDPQGKRAGVEALLQLRVKQRLRFSAGVLIAPRVGGRLGAEVLVFEDDDLAVSLGLRGLLSGVPGSLFLGGGPVAQLTFIAGRNVDVVTSASAEAFHGKGGNFFSTVLTAGIAVHL